MIEKEDCPTNSFEKGKASGKCWGNSHVQCQECKWYRADFKKHGQEYIDFAHRIQGQIKTTTS